MKVVQIAVLVVVISSFAAGGCGSTLVGTWNAEPIPAGEPFYIRQVTFVESGEYSASAKRGEENQRLRGKYEFNGFTLTLRSAGKNDRTYRAVLWWGKTLELTSDGNTHTFKKQ